MTTGTVTSGLQANVSIGPFVVSPFGTWSVTRSRFSTTQTSAMSYEYPSYSGESDLMQSTVFGFDVLYAPLGISLSSQLRRASQSSMYNISLKWLLGRR